MRGINCRGLRLTWVAGLGMAMALPALAAAASTATQTTLAVETHDKSGRTQANATVSVTAADGTPASGSVIFEDGNRQLAGVALDANGQATAAILLAGGPHSLHAVYVGNSSYLASTSAFSSVQAQTTGTVGYTLTVSPASASVTAGTAATTTVSVTPSDATALSSPLFVTLSCSDLPSEASCSFTPTQVEILSNTTSAVTSALVISTEAQGTARLAHPASRHANTMEWALLLPGIFGLGGLAWGARKRRWLQRLSLIALVGLATMMGATGCSPLYDYYHHGPTTTPATPSGTYTLTVTGQSTYNTTAMDNSTTFALTVK